MRRSPADTGDPSLPVVDEFNAVKPAFINASINEDVTADVALPG